MTIEDCRAEVQQFAILMEQRLRDHDHKPGWKNESPLRMAFRVRETADQLWARLVGGSRAPRELAEDAADTANYCMMVADLMGALR